MHQLDIDIITLRHKVERGPESEALLEVGNGSGESLTLSGFNIMGENKGAPTTLRPKRLKR
jgi:hypothetical protein